MLNRKTEEYVYKMINDMEIEEDKKSPDLNAHADVIVPLIYNMLNISEETADAYYWMETEGQFTYSAGKDKSIDFEIHKDYDKNCYVCICGGINIELYVSLEKVLQAIDKIADVLIDYEPD